MAEPIRLKFAIQCSEGTLSGAVESIVEKITPEWARFVVPVEVVERAGINLSAALPARDTIVMFVYLPPAQAPIQASGHISSCEFSAYEEVYTVVAMFDEIPEEDSKRIQDFLDAISGCEPRDRRRRIRRRGDLFVIELERMLAILAEMAEGKTVEFGEQFANLVGMKNTLGRRMDDKKRGESICFLIERLASDLARLLGPEVGLRKVKIRKVTGKEAAKVAKDKVFVGWEESRPQDGKSYCLYLQGGGVFRSAKVTQVLENHFRTLNSLYEIQTMAE
jgi:hypothetical protein